MPHLTIEYSANLEEDLEIQRLIDHLHETTAAIEAFPMAGLRTRGERRDHYRIADGHRDNRFVHAVLRIGHGRELEVRKAAGEKIFDALVNFLNEISAQRPLAISFEIQELDPNTNYKTGNIRAYLADRQGN